MADLADYQWLTGADALLASLASADEPVHQQLSRLRKSLSPARAALVVQQAELRRRAVEKFGPDATRMFFADIALQQATDLWTAQYKASRVAVDVPVVDFCCGIGGDLLAFAARGPASGWDRAAEIAHLAETNLQTLNLDEQANVQVGLVEEHPPEPEQTWHLDPDRRVDGRRSTQLEWHSPGPEIVEHWLQISPNGILKLAPATTVPTEWSERAELEWVSRDRQCRQQIAWFGELAIQPGQRCATSMTSSTGSPSHASFVGSQEIEAEIATSIGHYLYDTDPALRAAGLTGALAVEMQLFSLQQGAAYLTADTVVAHPLLSAFEVQEVLPLRTSTLAKHLASLGIGQLEIKKRGVTVDPARLRQQLKLRGDRQATLLLTRLGNREIAVLAQRCQGVTRPSENG